MIEIKIKQSNKKILDILKVSNWIFFLNEKITVLPSIFTKNKKNKIVLLKNNKYYILSSEEFFDLYKKEIINIFKKNPVWKIWFEKHSDIQFWINLLKNNNDEYIQGIYHIRYCLDDVKNFIKNKNIITKKINLMNDFNYQFIDISIRKINELINKHNFEKFFNQFFSNKNKNIINDDIKNKFKIIKFFYDNNKINKNDINNFLIKKISMFASIKEFESAIDQFINLFENNNIETLYERLKNDNIEIIKKENNFILVKINSFKEIKKYGSMQWCITYSENRFKSYNKEMTEQFLLFNFDKNIEKKYKLIGFNLDLNKSLIAAHSMDDEVCKKSVIKKYIKFINYDETYKINKILERKKDIDFIDELFLLFFYKCKNELKKRITIIKETKSFNYKKSLLINIIKKYNKKILVNKKIIKKQIFILLVWKYLEIDLNKLNNKDKKLFLLRSNNNITSLIMNEFKFNKKFNEKKLKNYINKILLDEINDFFGTYYKIEFEFRENI